MNSNIVVEGFIIQVIDATHVLVQDAINKGVRSCILTEPLNLADLAIGRRCSWQVPQQVKIQLGEYYIPCHSFTNCEIIEVDWRELQRKVAFKRRKWL